MPSNEYFPDLSHTKVEWTSHLINQSSELLLTDINGIKLKVNLLKRLEQYDSAIQFIKKTINLIPKNIDVKFLLMDLYLYLNDTQNAKKEVDAALDTFGNITSLIEKKKAISENARETHR